MSRAIDWEPTPPWMEHAACKGMDPELFFPERGTSPDEYAEIRAVCTSCPVREACLDYGMLEKFGFYGGKSERERRELRKARPPSPWNRYPRVAT